MTPHDKIIKLTFPSTKCSENGGSKDTKGEEVTLTMLTAPIDDDNENDDDKAKKNGAESESSPSVGTEIPVPKNPTTIPHPIDSEIGLVTR
jgi:hypothetical protein